MREGSPKRVFLLAFLLLLIVVGWFSVQSVAAQDSAVVRAVLFYSPSCPHCHTVMTEVLPPLEQEYGDDLLIAELDTSTPEGNALFRTAVTRYEPELVGVPMLLIGDHILIGSAQIPAELPGLIETYHTSGGIGWPELPGIATAVEGMEPAADNPGSSLRARFSQDLLGNSLSVVVLIGLLGVWIAIVVPRKWHIELSHRIGPAVFLAVLAIGMIAATYLAYVETTGTEAVCGPVGDCNTVQQSDFAMIFGVLPMAVFGLLGYLAILFVYVYAMWIRGALSQYAHGLVFVLSFFGLSFSIFLTFLEPFVIGATCAWCLTSAVTMGLLALFSAGEGWPSLRLMLRDMGLTK